MSFSLRTFCVISFVVGWSFACGGAAEPDPTTPAPAVDPEPADPLRLGERYYFDRDLGEVPNMDVSYVVVFHEDGTCRIADYESTFHCTYERDGNRIRVPAPTAAVGPDGPWDDETLKDNVEMFPWTYVVSEDGRTVVLKTPDMPELKHLLIDDSDKAGGIEIRELPGGHGKAKGKGKRKGGKGR